MAPLFPNSNRRQRAERATQRLQQELNRRQQSPQRILRATQELRSSLSGVTNRSLQRLVRSLVDKAREGVQQSGRPGSTASESLRGLLKLAGPLGKMLDTAIGQGRVRATFEDMSGTLSQAAGILSQMMGADDAPPPEEIGGEREEPSGTEPTGRDTADPGRQFEDRDPDEGLPPNTSMVGDRRLRVRVGGFQRIYALTDPILTGRMIPVASSNVHSIGYRFDFKAPARGKLIVRYLQKDKNAGGRDAAKVAGPTYAYDRISPDMFTAMRKAASKGKWVWDELRIRGSRVAHKKQYRLLGVSQGYVPRRATVLDGTEILARRKVRVKNQAGRVRQLQSQAGVRLGKVRPDIARQNVNRARRNGR